MGNVKSPRPDGDWGGGLSGRVRGERQSVGGHEPPAVLSLIIIPRVAGTHDDDETQTPGDSRNSTTEREGGRPFFPSQANSRRLRSCAHELLQPAAMCKASAPVAVAGNCASMGSMPSGRMRKVLTDEWLRDYGRRLAEGEPPLTDEQVQAAARILASVQMTPKPPAD